MKQIPLRDATTSTPPAVPTVDLYAPRRNIYTRAFTGWFRRIRLWVGGALLALFFGSAWLQWDGHQAIWWNLPQRQFLVFGGTLWPQDFILLSGLLIVAAFGLFFVTVFAGRIWCGYSCPQSLWTWLFMWCEKVTEGDRNLRIKRDAAPWTLAKLGRKVCKHGLWVSLALATGMTFVGYFAPVRDLVGDFFSGRADGWAYFWIGAITLATYVNAGWLREQVCVHMCPYARFQSVMFDQDTLIVSYDPTRGEPRGPRKRRANSHQLGLGDCIDCTLCVQVCPTGIDIREGLQIDCIGCAACADVCDTVMTKLGYRPGLVGYTTAHGLAGQRTRLLRPRLLGYALALGVMLALLGYAFATRPLVGLDVSKDRVLYRENTRGDIENVYRLSLLNKDQHAHRYRLGVEGLPGLQLPDLTQPLEVAAGDRLHLPVRLALAPERLPTTTNTITFTLQDVDDDASQMQVPSRFTGPAVR